MKRRDFAKSLAGVALGATSIKGSSDEELGQEMQASWDRLLEEGEAQRESDVLYRVTDDTIKVDVDGDGSHIYEDEAKDRTIFNHNGKVIGVDTYTVEAEGKGPIGGDYLGIAINDREDLQNQDPGENIWDERITHVGDSITFGEEVESDVTYEVTLLGVEDKEDPNSRIKLELSYPTA